MAEKAQDVKNGILLIAGNIVTIFGNILLSNALNIWIIHISGGTKKLGVIAAIGLIPTLVLTIFGGIISDTFNKKKIVVICDFLAGLLCFLMGFIIDETTLNIALIIAFKVSLNIISTLFKPAIISLPAYSISKNKRSAFNTYFNISTQSMQIAAPILAGVLIGLGLSIKVVFFLDGMTFLLSSFSEVFIACESTTDTKKKTEIAILEKFISAFTYIFSEKYLTLLITLASLANLFIAGYNMFLPYYANAIEKSYYGYLLSIEAFGGILGALSLRIKKLSGDGKSMEFNLFLSGILFNLFFFIQNIHTICTAVFAFGFFLTRFNVCFYTYLQNNVDRKFLGRIISTTTVIALILMPVGQIVFAFIIDTIGMYTLGAIGFFLCILYILYALIVRVYKLKI